MLVAIQPSSDDTELRFKGTSKSEYSITQKSPITVRVDGYSMLGGWRDGRGVQDI